MFIFFKFQSKIKNWYRSVLKLRIDRYINLLMLNFLNFLLIFKLENIKWCKQFKFKF